MFGFIPEIGLNLGLAYLASQSTTTRYGHRREIKNALYIFIMKISTPFTTARQLPKKWTTTRLPDLSLSGKMIEVLFFLNHLSSKLYPSKEGVDPPSKWEFIAIMMDAVLFSSMSINYLIVFIQSLAIS